MSFSGNRREFFNLIAKGAALGLVTFGFYRFWLSTYVRRHLWSGTSVGGDAPEYTGTPIELLLGFLFAVAILVPVYIAYFLVGLQAEIYRAFASIPLVIFIYLFAQFAIYRARRYRLSRTVWRGARFWMRGSGWDYAWRAALWTLFVVVTLGAALPWQVAALERFKMRHSYYGNLEGRFEGMGGVLFREAWPYWLGMLFLGAVSIFFPPLFLVVGPILYAFYKAIEWRWWLSGVRFGDVGFQSDLDNAALLGPYAKTVGWSVLLVFILGLVIAGLVLVGASVVGFSFSSPDAFARALARHATLVTTLLVIAGVFYIAAILAVGVVMQLYLIRDVWQRVTDTTSVYNLSAADNVVAEGDAANALGEGFADGLDVGGL
jgi:uncharacterized membrane protein YjgN (DUF898 family)